MRIKKKTNTRRGSDAMRGRIGNFVPVCSVAGLALIPVAFVMSSSIIPSSASADSGTTSMKSTSSEINVNVPEVLSIDVSDATLALEVEPNNFGSEEETVTVHTSNATGYKLYMNSDDTEDNNLVHTTDSTHKITSVPIIATAIAPGDFDENTWGYSMESGKWFGIPLAASPKNIRSTDDPGTATTTISFGVNLRNITAGIYKDTIVYSAIANYVPESRTLADITTMQAMTPDICANTTVGTSAYLTDVRGGGYINSGRANSYRVTKLADGNCWMTQNLNLAQENLASDLKEKLAANASAVVLDSTNSDVSAGSTYVLPASQNPGTTAWEQDANDNNHVWDQNANDTNIADGEPRGGLYTWYAATAGTGTKSMTTAGAKATASICPRGWQLPEVSTGTVTTQDNLRFKTGASGDMVDKSYYKLLVTYADAIGATAFKSTPTWRDQYKDQYWSGDFRSNLASAPLYFVPAGHVWGSAQYVGERGLYWSRAASSENSAYSLGFDSGNTYAPGGNGNKGLGFSVRCVAL